MAGNGGVTLRGAIQGSGLNSQLGGTGVDVTTSNWTTTAATSPTGVSNSVTFTGTSAGALTGQQVTILNNFANTNSQALSITGAAYNLAIGSATPTSITLANQHVGGTASQALTGSNTAAAGSFTEGLNASFGTTSSGLTNNGGAITNLVAGSSNNALMSVGVNTTTAGAKSGTVALTYASNGTISSLANTALTGGSVSVSGNVYNLAAANTIATPVSLTNVHFGGTFGTSALSIQNTAAVGSYTEGLNASFGSNGGLASNNGGVITNLAGQTSSTALTVGLGGAFNTSTTGLKSGTATVNLASSGTNSGLTDTGLTAQTVTVNGQVNNYAQAAYANYTGNGLFSGSATAYVINLGTFQQGNGVASGSLQLANIGGSAAYTDLMDGTFNLTGATAFSLSGFNSFTNLAGGNQLSSLTASLSKLTAGNFDQFVTLSWNGHNENYVGGANSISLELKGTVAAVPEPASYAMLLAGLGLMGTIARRRNKDKAA